VKGVVHRMKWQRYERQRLAWLRRWEAVDRWQQENPPTTPYCGVRILDARAALIKKMPKRPTR
jgi:hypothetical protein